MTLMRSSLSFGSLRLDHLSETFLELVRTGDFYNFYFYFFSKIVGFLTATNLDCVCERLDLDLELDFLAG